MTNNLINEFKKKQKTASFYELFLLIYKFCKNNIVYVISTDIDFANCQFIFELDDLDVDPIAGKVLCNITHVHHRPCPLKMPYIDPRLSEPMIASLQNTFDIKSIFLRKVGSNENRNIIWAVKSILLYAFLIDLESNGDWSTNDEKKLFKSTKRYLLDPAKTLFLNEDIHPTFNAILST